MSTTMYVIATLFGVLVVCGWLFLVGSLALTLATALLGMPYIAERLHLQKRRKWEASAAAGILGLTGIPQRSSEHLRKILGRVLNLAPTETKPKACACVKESAGQHVGALRVFNKRGHFLLREHGNSPAQVERLFAANLKHYKHEFPAQAGTGREACPECDPKSCPLRREARLSMQPHPA